MSILAPSSPVLRLSDDLQFGKAGEHLVCADLLLQGHAAYLTDQGLPYDVVADLGHAMCRIQVKATMPRVVQGRMVYAFSIRRAKNGVRKVDATEADLFAFVALDVRSVAYLPYWDIIGRDGSSIVQLIHFRADHLPNGPVPHHPPEHGKSMRRLEDYAQFPY